MSDEVAVVDIAVFSPMGVARAEWSEALRRRGLTLGPTATEVPAFLAALTDAVQLVVVVTRPGEPGDATAFAELLAGLQACRPGLPLMLLDEQTWHTRLRAVPTPAPSAELRNQLARLTPRQREVLAHVGEGHDNLKIAALLGVTEYTVKAHLSALYHKLEVENRVELALLGRRAGLRLAPEAAAA
jgi:DNA-binding CsgD family transcriptional regulator